MNLRLPFLLALGLPLVISAAAPAVLIDWGNGTGNTSAPASDPGWSNVGSCNGVGCVYLGDGWVLTANHVGAGDAYFENVQYPWVIGSDVRLHNPDDSDADLVMFLIYPPYPPALDVSIASAAPALGTSLVMIGNGRNRGASTSFDCGPGPPRQGFFWGSGSTKRWGTNFIEDVDAESHEPYFGTQLFGSVFDGSGGGHSTYEAQAALGDSGGAAFAWNGSSYDLAGILLGVGTCSGQTAGTAIYGNATFAADLSVYRDEIVETMLPEPAGGLVAGVAFLAAVQVGRRAARRPAEWANAGTRRACRGTACAASSPPRA